MRRRARKASPYDPSAGAGLQRVGSGGDPAAGPGTVGVRRLPEEPCPPTSTGGALAVTLLCCLPFGLISLGWGWTTRRRWKRNDLAGAEHAARMAELWMFGGVGAAVVVFGISAVVALIQYVLAPN